MRLGREQSVGVVEAPAPAQRIARKEGQERQESRLEDSSPAVSGSSPEEVVVLARP